MFISLHTCDVYCLPDNYLVQDSTLRDIRHVMDPRFTPAQISNLDQTATYSRCLGGSSYLPGVMGLNNMKNNDAMNVVFQALVAIPPLRDFFLDSANTDVYRDQSSVVRHFGELCRKVWSSGRFRSHVSPHEILQAVSTSSKRKFRIGERCDPSEFLLWFLNKLHAELGGTRKPGSSPIHSIFQGKLYIKSYKKMKAEEKSSGKGKGASGDGATESWEESDSVVPMLYLPLDVPATPLFKNESDKNIIPQLPLLALLEMYNGQKESMVTRTGERRQMIIRDLPQYLILHIRRFAKNNWFVEKNHTIVHFPVQNLEMKDFVDDQGNAIQGTKYNLLANIRHEGDDLKGGQCTVDVLHKANDQWYELQDLEVKDTIPQLIALSESYIQIWERQK
mmetsp:Transcript_30284/g.84643  ORF Transcript_30284/g.84643 Transcript_30284/m.84643 type:complete len:392 (+) Transcript_30284:458-1633(+)